MIRLDGKIFTHFDFILPLLVLPIICFSWWLIDEANAALAHKQLFYFFIGAFAFAATFLLPIRRLEWLIPLFYWICIALLALVLATKFSFIGQFFGVTKLGATRWLGIAGTSFTIQPSEIFKPAFLLQLAYLIKNHPPQSGGYNLKSFIKLSSYILLPFALIAAEPDLGSALIIALVGFAVLFIVGVNYRIWLAIIAALAIAAPLIYENLHDYQKRRIEQFISEKPSYQVRQSMIAIGSGGLYGKSELEATQTHFKFLPISTSDFIFAYTIERKGLIGGALLMLGYLLLIYHLLSINSLLAKDYFARSFTSALAFLIFLYVAINIAMTLGLAPVVGVPLPFFSYGGSSFVTFMVLFGIYENLLAFRFDFEYRLVRFNFS